MPSAWICSGTRTRTDLAKTRGGVRKKPPSCRWLSLQVTAAGQCCRERVSSGSGWEGANWRQSHCEHHSWDWTCRALENMVTAGEHLGDLFVGRVFWELLWLLESCWSQPRSGGCCVHVSCPTCSPRSRVPAPGQGHAGGAGREQGCGGDSMLGFQVVSAELWVSRSGCTTCLHPLAFQHLVLCNQRNCYKLSFTVGIDLTVRDFAFVTMLTWALWCFDYKLPFSWSELALEHLGSAPQSQSLYSSCLFLPQDRTVMGLWALRELTCEMLFLWPEQVENMCERILIKTYFAG